MIKVFTVNGNGKIEFTKAELEKLLNEVYAEGQNDCNCGKNFTWTSPYPAYLSDTITTNNTTVEASKNSAPTFKININESDAKAASKCLNDVFSKLSKELNF